MHLILYNSIRLLFEILIGSIHHQIDKFINLMCCNIIRLIYKVLIDSALIFMHKMIFFQP